jgi:hypothetical protein
VSELVGFDRLDRIIGFNIASCSYITTEMEPTTEQMENMELLKAIKEMIETQIRSSAAELKANQAKTDADRKERKAERKGDREEMVSKNGRQCENQSRGI